MKFNAVTILLFSYVLTSWPFILYSYTPVYIRAPLEISLVIFLCLCYKVKDGWTQYNLVLMWIFCCCITIFLNYNYATGMISEVFKILILFSMILLAKNHSIFRNRIRIFWIYLWLIAAVSVIVIYFGYIFDFLDFKTINFNEVVDGGAEYVYHSNFIGNYVEYNIFQFSFPKISWYMYEPVFLSFYFGLNILIARELFEGRNIKILFIVLNLIAGLLTFSNTFIIFTIFYLLYNIIEINFLRNFKLILLPVLIIVISTGLFLFLFYSDLSSFTSMANRIARLNIFLDIFKNNSILNNLFGNGVGYSDPKYEFGVASGILNEFIERGILGTILLLLIMYKLTKKYIFLFIYIVYFSLAWDMFFTPTLYLIISFIASSNKIQNNFYKHH